MNQLEIAREKIDQIDAQLANLFEERMQAVQGVIEYKKATGMPVLDSGREAQVIEKNTARIQNGELKELYAQWQKDLMALSRQYQAKVLGKDCVAYQGTEGAFAHIALKRLFPYARQAAYPDWKQVFEAVEQESAEYGVLPFENSTTGDVGEVLDLCFVHSCHIVQVYDLPVEQTLLGVQGAELSDIKTVYSHPQGLRQSADFLKQMNINGVEYPNTAMAAKYVAQTQDIALGAIASKETAQLYGLKVLAEQVNKAKTNTTRFVVIARKMPQSGNRFSILFTVDHAAGQLAKAVQLIGEMGFSMECIKSRPLPDMPWEYYFYVELIGDASHKNSRSLLEKMQTVCKSVKRLGVYTKEETK